MNRTLNRISSFALALAAGGIFLAINESPSQVGRGSFMTSAQAIIGRPLTPLSYAGVARRTTRRAVVGGAVVGATMARPMVVAPACVQAVDVYGRIYTRC
jgi:hypothetical protein